MRPVDNGQKMADEITKKAAEKTTAFQKSPPKTF